MGTFAEQMCVWAPGAREASRRARRRRSTARVRRPHRVQRGPQARRARHPTRAGPIAIIGAAGGLGHYAVQIAHAFGYRVVGVDVGEERLEFVRSLGAEHVVSADDAAGVRVRARWRRRRARVRGPARRASSSACRCCSAAACSSRSGSRRRATATSSCTRGRCSSRPDDHLLRGRHRAGDARARRPRRGRAGEDARVAGRRAVGRSADLRRARGGQVPRPRGHHRPDPVARRSWVRRRRSATDPTGTRRRDCCSR